MDIDNNATIARVGTIKITDGDMNVAEISFMYAASDVIRLLDEGHTIEEIAAILNEEKK